MKTFDDTVTFAGKAKEQMAGLIIKEYQIYCKNFKDCHSWDILTANTSRKEAEEAALKRGWEKGPDGMCTGEQDLKWICPKCLKKQRKQSSVPGVEK